MNQNDYTVFAEAWANAHEVMPGGKTLSIGAMQLVIDALKEYPLTHLLGAIKKHLKSARFAPVPADIIEIIATHTGAKHIGAEEAWGLALESFDEFSTVVWTPEIAEARGIAADIYHSGDKIGARMAFKEAYNRIIATTSKRPKWLINAGFDPEHRAVAIQQAIAVGRLPNGSGSEYLLGVDAPTATVAGLISHAQAKTGKVDKPEAIQVIKTILEEAPDFAAQELQRREQNRLAFEAHRQAELEKVDLKLQGAAL